MIQSREPQIDSTVRVVTPENIEFEYLIAGPFQRLPAFATDFALRAGILIALVILAATVGIPLAGDFGGMITAVVAMLGFFILSWLYGTVLEATFNGRTLGKALFGLRVISVDGRPINGSQAALRNFLRLCDLAPPISLTIFFNELPAASLLPSFFVGLSTMTLTRRMQRLGDLAAGTMVICESRRGYSRDLNPDDNRAFALAELVPATFQVTRTLAQAIGLFMERRRGLSVQRREEVAGTLARPLIHEFGLPADTGCDLLLCALYVRTYHSQEQRAAKLALARAGRIPQPVIPQAAIIEAYSSSDARPTGFRTDDRGARK